MAGLSDLLGKNGVLEQLVLWGLMSQILGAEFGPFLVALQQDVDQAHPLSALPADVIVDAYIRGMVPEAEARVEAARNGIDAARFATLVNRARVRLSPPDLATAVLRSYMTAAAAEAEAKPQGITAAQLGILTDLAGDAPGPQQLAEALRRGIIARTGRGAGATSYDQGIAESRLHNKWGPVLESLSAVLLSPDAAASAVVRNFMSRAAAGHVAAQQGVDATTLDTMIHLAGDAPGPQQLAEALRRGAIPAAGTGPGSISFAQGIAEGRLADKWAPVIRDLAKVWPTPVDALDAELKGQITAAQGTALYEQLGGDLQFHSWLLATIGDSPTPLEAAALAARGIIAEHGTGPAALSYDQAVKESRYRNKWGAAYRQLGRHIPPPSTIVSMLAHRQIDEATAHQLLLQNDMTAEVAAAYIGEAAYESVSDYRGLTQGAVLDMYYNHLVSRAQAETLLDVLHVSKAAAGLLLDYADMHYLIDSINRSVQRIAQLFTGRKISVATAKSALMQLEIPATTVDEIIGTWQIQAAANVKTLTATQIVDAWYYGIMTEAEALGELEAIGYTPYDAWTLLSLKAKGPLPGKPARTVAPPPGAVLPGLT